jgi:glycosyltransferase involved in cell wall biosynthesis
MRIGIDYTSAVRQRAGIGRYTREMVSALLALESPHHYTLFAATGGLPRESLQSAIRNPQSAIRNSQFSIRTLPLSDDWLARLWHRLRLPIPVELFTGPLDIFYSPDFVLPPVLRATRTMLTVHDLSFMRHPEAFVSPLRRYLGRVVPRSIERSDWVLADSAHTRSDLITLFGVPPEKVEVLYSGVDSRFSPRPETEELVHLRERYGIGARPYVLSVGTLQPRKNFVRLIRAFARLRDERLVQSVRLNQSVFDLQLVIAGGKGWLYEEIFAEAERHESVRLIGFVDDADLPALYRNAALFAFPSLYEGFGLPVLEAMACGTPVVCSSKSSLPEVAGEAGLLVDPLDVDALSEAMARVLEDKTLREEMVARGYAQAAQFTWERAATQLLRMMNGE